MAIVKVAVLPWQAEFLRFDGSTALVVGGFASGKSWIAANWLVDRVLQFPEGKHYVCAKDLPQVKRGPILTIRGVLADRNIDHRYNSTTGEITFDNGGVIGTLSAASYLGFRALECDTIWADELTEWGPSGETAFIRFLAPRLRYSPTGKKYKKVMKPHLRVTTNPSGIGSWLHKLATTPTEDGRFFFDKVWNVGVRDNYLMEGHAKYIAEREASLSKDLWPFLLDGQWGSVTTGAVYKNFRRDLCIFQPPFPLDPLAVDLQKPLLWALDFNVGLMCSTVSQYHPQRIILDRGPHRDMPFLPVKMVETARRVEVPGYQRGLFYVLDEVCIKNAGTPDVAAEFIRRWGTVARQTGVILYGDASGGGKSQQLSAQAAARSNWAILINALKTAGIKVEFRVQMANPAVLDRVNAVKSQIETGDGRGLCIDPRCERLLMDLEAVVWKEGTNDVSKENDELTHVSDAFGYMVWVERTIAENGAAAINWRRPEDQ